MEAAAFPGIALPPCSVCLLAVLTFFLGMLWKIVFAGKSLFFYLGFG